MKLWRALRRRLSWRSTAAARLRAQADERRAAGRFREAAILYVAAHDLSGNARLLVQAGHMFKEAGDLASAEQTYLSAFPSLRGDGDLLLQLGHFYKVCGRTADAADWYRQAAEAWPDRSEPRQELQLLIEAGLDGSVAVADAIDLSEPIDIPILRHLGSRRGPGDPGGRPVLKGVESIRGICISTQLLVDAELWIGGSLAAAVPVTRLDSHPHKPAKHVFHFWYDFSNRSTGTASLEIRVRDAEAHCRIVTQKVHIGQAPREADYPDTDAVVNVPITSEIGLDEFLSSRPSMVRNARRRFLATPPKTILVLRADQMGDMAVSVPALNRLRSLVPGAQLVGVVTVANVDLARTLGLFDALETVTWGPQAANGARQLLVGEEDRIARVMRSYHPDMAIDLLVNGDTRPLLALSGAPCTVGFDHGARWPWLTLAVSTEARDARTGHETAAHAAKMLALVEAAGTLLAPVDAVATAPPSDGCLESFDLVSKGFAVLHGGGRYGFSRWPGFADLASRLLAETRLDIVFFGASTDLSPPTRENSRLRVIEGEVPFSDFDTLLSNAAVFVGNDSGPKHLAALRGTPVVSLHSSRIDWREWGQTQTGLVISRRLPCAGCSLHGSGQDECGKAYACITDIRVEEVMGAVRSLLDL